MLKDGNKAVRITATLIKSPDSPNKYDQKLLEKTIDGITNVDSLSTEYARPCTINTKSVKDGSKTITTTTTVIPILKMAIDKKPTFLTNIPCKVDTRTVKDGKKECLITTTLAISEDPDDIRNLDSMAKSPNMSDAKPGTFSRETVDDGDDKITVATTRVTIDDVPTKKKGKDKNKDKKPVSETKPGIVTTSMVKEGGKPAILTTTLVPMQGTPKGYETNVLDLLKSGFPGLNTVAEEDCSPCTVTIDTIPEGNKTTTVTKASFKEAKEPEGVPCMVTTKTVKDGKKESLITTTLTISKDKANNQQIQSIPNGFPVMDDARPATFNSETVTEGGEKFKINTTKITEEASKKKGFKGFKGFKGSKDKKPVTENTTWCYDNEISSRR